MQCNRKLSMAAITTVTYTQISVCHHYGRHSMRRRHRIPSRVAPMSFACVRVSARTDNINHSGNGFDWARMRRRRRHRRQWTRRVRSVRSCVCGRTSRAMIIHCISAKFPLHDGGDGGDDGDAVTRLAQNQPAGTGDNAPHLRCHTTIDWC